MMVPKYVRLINVARVAVIMSRVVTGMPASYYALSACSVGMIHNSPMAAWRGRVTM